MAQLDSASPNDAMVPADLRRNVATKKPLNVTYEGKVKKMKLLTKAQIAGKLGMAVGVVRCSADVLLFDCIAGAVGSRRIRGTHLLHLQHVEICLIRRTLPLKRPAIMGPSNYTQPAAIPKVQAANGQSGTSYVALFAEIHP